MGHSSGRRKAGDDADLPRRLFRRVKRLAADATDVYAALKPPWCQPWSILATGSVAVAVAWRWFPWRPASAAVVTFAVLLWWYVFLVLYPSSVLEHTRWLQEEREDSTGRYGAMPKRRR